MYLDTIKEYFLNDETFCWNFGFTLAKLQRYDESIEFL